MSAANINNYTMTIDPDPPENLDAFKAVSVSVLYADVSWLSTPQYLANQTITGNCVMPAEGDGAIDPDSSEAASTKKNKKANSKKTNSKKNKKNT